MAAEHRRAPRGARPGECFRPRGRERNCAYLHSRPIQLAEDPPQSWRRPSGLRKMQRLNAELAEHAEKSLGISSLRAPQSFNAIGSQSPPGFNPTLQDVNIPTRDNPEHRIDAPGPDDAVGGRTAVPRQRV